MAEQPDDPPLLAVLAHLRFLYLLHQDHHWLARGDSFYGDHLLFQRLYETADRGIDAVAEKVVGLGDEPSVDLGLHLATISRLLVRLPPVTGSIPKPESLARRSLSAEESFLDLLSRSTTSLRRSELLTSGLENLLAQVADDHEGSVYLLRRRLS